MGKLYVREKGGHVGVQEHLFLYQLHHRVTMGRGTFRFTSSVSLVFLPSPWVLFRKGQLPELLPVSNLQQSLLGRRVQVYS